MVGEIKDYIIDDANRVTDVVVEVTEDTGAVTETTRVVIPVDIFTATYGIEKINEMLRRRVVAKGSVPTKAQLELILPIGFKTQVPG
jgi:hypothetical protein